MGEAFGRTTLKLLAGLVGASLLAVAATAQTQGEPPGRVGRLAFVDGTVSFHDDEQSGWTKAVVNTPLTSGDAIWTEPNARSEVSVAGTRIRMDGSTELDMSQIDDEQVRLQLAQGRIDVKTFAMDTAQPYEIVTPRGTVTLQQQGDYYVEAGSTQDPTRLGVRAGAAQIQGLDGKVLAVRAGEVGEVFGDGSALQLRTIQAAPPAPAASWAARDRQVIYDQQPQYVPAGMTGYEDLNAYGNWVNDGRYGQVWVPRSTPPGWAPYRTGHWSYVKPWGWTWIDEQPWGFAPYHYGRWANSNNRWVWVPPQREQRPVYAPALVAFVGGLELAAQLGNQGRNVGPVGWFPLGPREAYVPPYSTNRDYYQRINRSAQIQDRDLNDRWERAQRREAFVAGRNSVLANQRFATVVPSQTFVRSQPVQRAALTVTADQMAKAAVAPVSAPPAPTASVAAAADAKTAAKPEAPDAKKPPIDAKAAAEAKAKPGDVAVPRTAVADMPTLARPTPAEKQTGAKAPGPKFVSTDTKSGADAKPKTADSPDVKTAKPATPPLQPRQGAAPPPLKETNKAAPEPSKPEAGKPDSKQDGAKPAVAPTKEAPPVPPKPALASPDPSPAKRDEPKRDEPQKAAPTPEKPTATPARPDDRKQAAPEQAKPTAAPQPKPEDPKQAAPAPKPAATPPSRQEEPRQATPQPAPKPEAAPRPEAPRQAAPQPRAEPPQPAQPPRPQQQAPQPPQQQAPKEKESRAPGPQPQQLQIAQPPKAEPQQQPQRGNNNDNKEDDKK
ncbi:DUF6600 domain-containing protein [Reyranella sp.]|uniref:DUF6600 domain-containing protein n=1 Tax=Reyranella sp. TaxID=1929291 RepID=UPI003F72281F